MHELLAGYQSVFYSIGALGVLMLVQLLIADIAGIKAGRIPGTDIPNDHASFLFRAARTVANINESVVIFLLAVLFCLSMGAAADTTATLCWVYLGSRIAYACCYYGNIKLLRSACFVVSLIGIAGLLFIGFTA